MRRPRCSVRFVFGVIVLLGLVAQGCGQTPQETPAAATPAGDPFGAGALGVTVTPTEYEGFCSPLWASQSLPQLSASLDKAFIDAGMPQVASQASAYGESCLDMGTNVVVYFTPLQIDYFLNVVINDVSDPRELGEWVVKILTVLENVPLEEFPDIRPGQVKIQYQDRKRTVVLEFSQLKARELIKEGKRGTVLYDALSQP